jgi:hypothetical protein
MYSYALMIFLVILAGLLIHYKPTAMEGFAVAAVDPVRVPACVERSAAAQKLLARIAEIPQSDANAAELRLLVSKLCCLEADIATPAAGSYRTLPLQFRTSHDMEPPSTFVGRCLRNAVRDRDVELVMEKYETRGKELIRAILGDCAEAHAEFAAVAATTQSAMVNFCLRPQPAMDKPLGARDMGFWEPVASDLFQYQGISAQPK